METNDLGQKGRQLFSCLNCDFNTYKKNHYTRHLETIKHKKRSILMETNDLGQKGHLFECECGISYKHKPSLYKHKKKCDYNDTQLSLKEEGINYKEIINELINQNKAFQNTIIEQNKKIIELAEKPVIINNTNNTNNTTNTNNTNNQNLNINLFLNENCKDAIHIDDFVKQIVVSLNDLLFIKDKGIVKGLANIINNNLNELPLYKRPIWCSDKKRKKIFIKELDWSEDINNVKTKQAIDGITRIQSKNIVKYKEKYPNYMDTEHGKEKFINFVKKNTESTKDKEDNIINNIIDNIYLDDKYKQTIK